MTVQSYTGTADTDGAWETVASVTGLTFTPGKQYTMQIRNIAYLRIANAIFYLKDQLFTFTQGEDDLYIKAEDNANQAVLTILENA